MDQVNQSISESQSNRSQQRSNLNNMEGQFNTYVSSQRESLNKQDQYHERIQSGVKQIFSEFRDKQGYGNNGNTNNNNGHGQNR